MTPEMSTTTTQRPSMTASVFSYVLNPGAVQANTRASFTLVATNGDAALQLTTDDEIYLALPVGTGASDLTPDLGDVNTQAPANWRFSKSSPGDEFNFVISPTRAVTVAANAVLLFQLNKVIINAAKGSSTVRLSEFIGAGESGSAFAVMKSEAVLSIIAQAIPATVGRNATTTLKWTAAKAAYVSISPLNVDVDTVGQQLTTPSKDVTPEASQVTYSFTAWTADQQFARDSVTVTISAPVIDKFEPQDSAPIDYEASVTLEWDVDYAETVSLDLPRGKVQKPASGALLVQPRTMLAPNGDVATYTLRATGAGKPVMASLQIPFKPMVIDYFRYPAAGDTGNFEFNVTNGGGQVDQYLGYFQLTATGPGGPLVQYLGDYPALQVQLFLASAASVAAGAPVTLSWQTVQAVAWAMTANGKPLAIVGAASGSVVDTPGVSTDYLLTATDSAGNTVTSSLTVTVPDAN